MLVSRTCGPTPLLAIYAIKYVYTIYLEDFLYVLTPEGNTDGFHGTECWRLVGFFC